MKHIIPASRITPTLPPAYNSIDLLRPRAPVTSAPFSPRKDLPVLGRAQGGDTGNLVIEENPIDWTFRPADLQGVQGAFAVFVTGDSMVPKYKDRDIAYIHPAQRPHKGRFVLVETAEHKGLIKQFIKWEADTLYLKQFNPDRMLHVPRKDVRQIMLVIGSLDS